MIGTLLIEKVVGMFSPDQVKPMSGKAEYGVLGVAMMIAALDGKISPTEFAAFRRLAEKCNTPAIEGGSLWDAAIRAAGYMWIQSQILTERQLIAAFVNEARDNLLPAAFKRASATAIRRAFAMWISMAMADGEYAGIERKCINSLRAALDDSAVPSQAFMNKAAALLGANDLTALEELICNG